jgi:hypothetical protein
MRFLIAVFILMTCLIYPAGAADEINLDYYFLYNGGVFFHRTGQPVDAFEHFAIPITAPYTNAVYAGDMALDGSFIGVLRGDESNKDRYDLVRIDTDLKFTPLFGLITRESLGENEKVNRSFGSVDIDLSNQTAVFSVNERIASISNPLESKYSSNIYRIPIKGGIVEKIGSFPTTVKDISSGGGLVIAIFATDDSGIGTSLKTLPSSSTEWVEMGIPNLDARSVDISPDGSSALLMGKPGSSKDMIQVVEIKSFGKSDFKVELLEEMNEDEAGTFYKYTLDGKSILFKRKRSTPWGDMWINYLKTGNGTWALVRDDFGFSFNPVKTKKIPESNIAKLTAALDKNEPIGTQGKLSLCGTKSGQISVISNINPEDGSAEILNFEGGEKKLLCPQSASDKILGLYLDDKSTVLVENLELGERLISFESIPYGKATEIDSENISTQHEIHLSWNIGGKMVGIEVPEDSMCIGGDDESLHLILKSSHKGMFSPSTDVTPFYMLERSNWMLEHPRYLGDVKTTSGFFVRSFTDEAKNLYLLDSLSSRIIKYGSERKNKTEIGWLPDGIPSLAYPTDMALYENHLYVLDSMLNRIVVFNTDGDPLSIINLDTNHYVCGDLKFLEISKERVRIVDLKSQRLVEFTLKQ